MRRVTVIGIGNEFRCDDGIGLYVAAWVRRLCPMSVDVQMLDGEPTRIIDAWREADWAIVVDAAKSSEPAGRFHRLELPADALPPDTSTTSSHGGGLALAYDLGCALGAVPDRLTLFAIVGAAFDHGVDLTPLVARTGRLVARQIVHDIEGASDVSC